MVIVSVVRKDGWCGVDESEGEEGRGSGRKGEEVGGRERKWEEVGGSGRKWEEDIQSLE
jgi:hypothetical protein